MYGQDMGLGSWGRRFELGGGSWRGGGGVRVTGQVWAK